MYDALGSSCEVRVQPTGWVNPGPGEIVRRPLRAQVRGILLDRIIRGILAGGTRINETHLAAELKVSRTPLREALLGLQREGFLDAEMGRGFLVPPLSAEELGQVSPINAALEALAVRTIGEDIRHLCEPLAALNAEIQSSMGDPPRVFELNVRWHQLLTGPCGNRELQRMLAAIRERCYRYQFCYMHHLDELESLRRSRGLSPRRQPLIDAVRAGDADLAADLAYRMEFESGQVLAEWLETPRP